MKPKGKSVSLLIAALWLTCFVSGCLDNNDPLTVQEQFDKDAEIIDQFLSDNNIDAQIDNSGLRYVINEQGTGDIASSDDSIKVNYEGRILIEGTVFDSGNGTDFLLSRLIAGWQVGTPLIHVGGSITLYIPSIYGFGSLQNGNIPANSVLVFDIELLEVF